MIERAVAGAVARRGGDRLPHIGAGARDGIPEAHLLRQAGRDRRGERAAGAMRAAALDAGVLEAIDRAVMEQQVDDPVALEMAALHQHSLGAERQELLGGALHLGLDAHADQSRPRALICGNAGIVGMGLMGSSIAACLLVAGHTVAAVEVDPVKRRKAPRQVLSLLEGLRRERLLKTGPRKILQKLTVSDNYSDLQHSEIVVECVTEDLNVKRDVIRKIEQVVSPDTIIGSNTSAIPPTELQQGALHPKRILGTHWAEPAHITRFMEIICGKDTLPVYADRALALTRQLGKEPSLLHKDVRGFITNRVMYAMLREAERLPWRAKLSRHIAQ